MIPVMMRRSSVQRRSFLQRLPFKRSEEVRVELLLLTGNHERAISRQKGITSVFGTQNWHTQTIFTASISSDIDDTSDDDEDDEGSTTSELSSAAAGQTERSGSRGTPRFDGRRRKSNIQKATTSLSGTQTRRTQTTSTTGTTSERRMGTSRVSSERVVRIRSAVTDRPTEATETTIANGRMLYRKRNSPSAT
eukprot:gb/GECG01011130.1/.p1 GENE.gb/GECG01011130.1/~~gb/GECG01011130.1/.p1  ORF type:complete len:193 (+),score=21.90 gb/GECG01011130.1/:1-579(+)